MYHELNLPLAFYYDTQIPVPIPDVIKALSALDKLSRGLPGFLSSLSGATVDSCVVQVDKIESGSLKECLDVALRFLTKAEKQKFEKWLKTTKMGKVTRYAGAGILLSAGVLILASSLLSLADRAAGTNAPSISASHSVIMISGGDLYNATPAQMDAAINAAMIDEKKKMAAAAIDFVHPSSSHNGGHIYAGDDKTSGLKITKEAARDAPDRADFAAVSQDISYTNVSVDIRSLNRDSDSSGWVARVPSIAQNKKLSMTFDPGVHLGKALTDPIIQADITVTYTQTPKTGKLSPKSFVVTAIH